MSRLQQPASLSDALNYTTGGLAYLAKGFNHGCGAIAATMESAESYALSVAIRNEKRIAQAQEKFEQRQAERANAPQQVWTPGQPSAPVEQQPQATEPTQAPVEPTTETAGVTQQEKEQLAAALIGITQQLQLLSAEVEALKSGAQEQQPKAAEEPQATQQDVPFVLEAETITK